MACFRNRDQKNLAIVVLVAVGFLVLGGGLVFSGGAQEATRPTRITYLSSGSADVEQAHDQKWVEAFNNSRSDIQVDYELTTWADLFTRLYADIGAGRAPDVVWYGFAQIYEWQQMGILEPLDNWIGPELWDQYLPHLTSPGSEVFYDGHIYGAPFTQAARTFIVRRDWLEAAGYPPENIRTWDDLIAAAAAVTDPSQGRYAISISLAEDRMVGAALHHYFAPSHGLRNAVDFRPEMRSSYVEMLANLQRLAPYMPPAQTGWTHRDSIVSYVNGTVAIALQGSFFQGDLANLAPEITSPRYTAVMPVPAGGSQDRPTISAYSVGYVMMRDSQNKEAAAEFIKFMADNRVAREWAMNVSPHQTVTIDDRVEVLGEQVRWWENEWARLFAGDGRTDLKAVEPYSPVREIDSIKAEVITDLLAGRLSPDAAYEQMKSRVEAVWAR